MKFSILFIFGIFVIIIITFPLQSVLGQSQEQITLYSNKELVMIGLELTEQNLVKGNYDAAIIYSKFAYDAFARSLQVMRSIDATLADEIHITLVEIQADTNSRVSSDTILQKISSVKSMLDQIKSDPLLSTNVLAQMLSVADEKTQSASELCLCGWTFRGDQTEPTHLGAVLRCVFRQHS